MGDSKIVTGLKRRENHRLALVNSCDDCLVTESSATAPSQSSRPQMTIEGDDANARPVQAMNDRRFKLYRPEDNEKN
ncbi:hypothetical protein Tco_0915524 [Tanacetum coccineum]